MIRPILLLIIALLPLSFVSAEDLKIGTTLSLTGPYGTYGNEALHGIEMAVDEANARGGVDGRKVKLFVENFETLDLKRAAAGARKLVDVDKVDVFLPLIVEDGEVVIPITSKVPLFTMVVGCGARKCGSNLGKYNVRAASSHDAIVERLVTYSQTQNVKHVCEIVAQATYFEGYGRYIEELSKRAGQEVTYAAVPLSNSEDYREIATKFKYAKCDAIYAWIPIGSVGGFFRRVRESGQKALIMSIVETDDPSILAAAGPAAEGVVFAKFGLGSDEFRARYQKRYNEQPSRPALPAYDGVKLLLETIGKVGTDAQKLHDAIVQVKDHPAENGVLTFTPDGERLGEEVHLMRIQNGTSVEIP